MKGVHIMASNTTSSIYGSGVSSKRVTGLMSGLDTEDLVKQMSQNTQIRINRQFQAQQKLVYKQDAFRDVISKLVKFSDTYFSATSKTNILSPSFFRANTVKPSSSNVTVSGDTEALKNFSIDEVISVASAARFTSNKEISSGVIESNVFGSTGEFNALAGQSMTFKSVSNETTSNYTIKIDPNFAFDPSKNKLEQIKDELNNQINKHTALKNNNVKYEITAGNELHLNTGTFGSALEISAVDNEIKTRLNIDVGSLTSEAINDTETFMKSVNLKDVLANGQISFDYNGVQKSISFPSDTTISSVEELKTYLKDKLDSMYGSGKIDVASAAGTNNLLGITSVSQDISSFTGLSAGNYNRINRDEAISKAKFSTDGTELDKDVDEYKIDINGVKFSFSKEATLNDIIKEINSSSAGITFSHSSTSDKLTAVSKETGAHMDIVISDEQGNLAEVLFGKKDVVGGYKVEQGTDTVITVTKNGVPETLTRSTSNISFDGINIGLSNKAVGEKDITFAVSEETDKVVEKMAKFVEDYNEIVTYLDEVIRQRPDRKYQPLTDEQRRDMSESEIKLWDEKAKEGMLYLDSDMNSMLYSWKEAISGFVEGNPTHMSSIGISPSSGDYTGKLVFDENKFRQAYANDSTKIEEFFTNNAKGATANQKGIAQRLKDVVSRNVGIMGEKGILVERAGTKGTSSEKNNFLYERIKEYDDMIAKLKTRLKTEQEKYYAKFSALETALAKMNSQSSWLSSQFQQ
jgi:flagellar hook-associated protein 2